MKKRILPLLCLMVLLLTSCAGELWTYSVDSMRGWYFQSNPGSNDYSVFFGLLDENNQGVAADMDVDIRIVNANGEEVYKASKSVTLDDFADYNSKAHGDEYLAEIRIPQDEIKAGTSADGKVYLKVHKDGIVEFDEVNCDVAYCLPVQDVTLTAGDLPQEINVKEYNGSLAAKIRIDDVTYTYDKDYGSNLNVTVSGVKTYGKASSYSLYDIISYKLYDDEGYMVDSGSLYLDNLNEGDKFRDNSIVFYDVVPGKAYTLKFEEYHL